MNNFMSTEGDLEAIFVDDYAMIDQFAATGSLWLWGDGSSGRLGDNTTVSKSSPVQTIAGGTNWSQISCSVGATLSNSGHSAAIKTDGALWLWGANDYGQLGDNTRTNRSSPVQTVSAGTNWKQVSSGSVFVGAIKTDGTLWMWGYNARGQLGDSTIADRSSPVQTIAGGTSWKQVSCGARHSAAIKTDGTLWTWGDNGAGQLGDNTITNRSSPVQTIAAGTNWKQVSCGGYHTVAIKTDGTLWLWGDNSNGQLGDSTIADRSSPVQTIAGGTSWKQVDCSGSIISGNNTAAIKTDGTLWTWGDNGAGQLGDNTITNRSSPVQTIAAGTNWKQVSCSYSNMAAIKTDGTLWTWGNNGGGQLGDNSTTRKSSPVQTIAGGTNWKQASCGQTHAAAIHFYDAGNLYPNA